GQPDPPPRAPTPVPAPRQTPSADPTVALAPAPSAKPALSFEADARAIHAELVAVDTSHGNETKALLGILERLKSVGVHGEIVESAPGRGSLVARIKGNGTKKPLLLLAHIDVVPVEGQPWTVPPFAMTEKDGFLWGRGISDDKAMAAA